MGRRKKRKLNPDGPGSYKKWLVGDEVMCTRESDGKLGSGEILAIHLDCHDDIPRFTFCCDMIGSYQLAKFSSIVEQPSLKQKKKRNKARIKTMAQK